MIDFSKIDKTIHEKGRLAIMTLVASRAEWSFQDLKAALKMSDGNLITHLRALNSKGYVSIQRDKGETKRRTVYTLTKAGRAAFQNYLRILESIIQSSKPK